jgi:hypothetical protein
MDTNTFDDLTKLLGTARNRRSALGALLGAALAHPLLGPVEAKRGRHGKRKDRHKGKDHSKGRGESKRHGGHPGMGRHAGKKKDKPRQRDSRNEGAALIETGAVCYSGSPCVIAPKANLTKCDLSGVPLQGAKCTLCNLSSANLKGTDASGADLSKANLQNACLVDTILTGANLTGVNFTDAIFCRTTMSNGGRNDSGCSKGTSCCPTCDAAHPCPTNQVCCNGTCVTGNCCANADCLDPAKPVCLANTCRPCTSNVQCGLGRRCCGGQCRQGDCCTASDCADRQCQSKTCESNRCTYAAVTGGTCNDGNRCTVNDTCQNGACVGTAKDCSAQSDACNDGICRQSDGACVKRAKANGTACSDNDNCTVGDSCQGGACTPGAGLNCSHLDDQCNVGVCQTDGTCGKAPRANDTRCLADGNFCNEIGACRSGACVAGPAVVCTASDECHRAGSCDPATGHCSNPTAPDGTPCGTGGSCHGGTCVGQCLAVNSVCDASNDTCCTDEEAFCDENPACGDAGEARCCRPEGAACDRSCDCCGGVCADGVCCVLNQQCADDNECCAGQSCIGDICTDVCGTSHALCGAGPGDFPCCDGYRCVNGECWPGTCLALTERCTNASECCPAGAVTCDGSAAAPVCCHPYNATCQETDACCSPRVCGPESKCCIGSPFDPDRPMPFGTNIGVCSGREHECCPGRRCHPAEKWCCVDEGQPVPNNEGGFLDCCHFAQRDGVCTCHRDGETCSAPGGNPFFSTCCDGLICANGQCQAPCGPWIGGSGFCAPGGPANQCCRPQTCQSNGICG